MFGGPWISLADSFTWAAFSLSCNHLELLILLYSYLNCKANSSVCVFWFWFFFGSSTSYLEWSLHYYCWYCCCLKVKVVHTIQKKTDWLKLSVWCRDCTCFRGLLIPITGFSVDRDGTFETVSNDSCTICKGTRAWRVHNKQKVIKV